MTKKEALTKAMKLCSTKEYAPFEIEEKLVEWGLERLDIVDILKTLRDEKFLDESRMARFFVNDKLRFNKWGRVKIRYALQQKKVSQQAISDAFDQINEDEYLEILKHEITKKAKSLKETDMYKYKAKLFQFAASKGFEGDVIYRIIDHLHKNKANE
jgi:regulatory protein